MGLLEQRLSPQALGLKVDATKKMKKTTTGTSILEDAKEGREISTQELDKLIKLKNDYSRLRAHY